jgi:hypothetical protein
MRKWPVTPREAKLTERGLGTASAQKAAEDVSEIVDAVVQR